MKQFYRFLSILSVFAIAFLVGFKYMSSSNLILTPQHELEEDQKVIIIEQPEVKEEIKQEEIPEEIEEEIDEIIEDQETNEDETVNEEENKEDEEPVEEEERQEEESDEDGSASA